jgi:heme exporter protein C
MKRALFVAAAGACALGFAYTIWLIFYVTPLDRELYFNQKIFYYHVPSFFVLFVAVFVCGIYSVLYLKRRQPRHDDVAQAAGELAVLFGGVGLVTGSIWGKAAWGYWWVWDLRLTTTLLLWVMMIGCVLVRRFAGPGSERLAAGLAAFSMANVPLVYFSVKIAEGLHPKTSVVPGLESSMRGTFWLSVLLFMIFFSILLHTRVELGRAERRVREARELGLDEGLLE